MKALGYAVRYQWRRVGGLIPGGDPTNWRHWREFGSVGRLFPDRESAEDYMHSTAFKNMAGLRKPSCSVVRVIDWNA